MAQSVWLMRLQTEPAHLTHLLPVQLLSGAAVGLAIPSLLGAGSVGMSAARLGTGSGVLNTARRVSTVLGVPGVVAAAVQPTLVAAALKHDRPREAA